MSAGFPVTVLLVGGPKHGEMWTLQDRHAVNAGLELRKLRDDFHTLPPGDVLVEDLPTVKGTYQLVHPSDVAGPACKTFKELWGSSRDGRQTTLFWCGWEEGND